MSDPFSIDIRVYYEDTDAGGIVYNANYIEQDELMSRNIAFVVKHMDVDFVRPAKFNDVLKVTCEPVRFGGASITFSQHVYSSQGDLLVKSAVKIACVDLKEMRPILIPNSIKEVIQSGS